MDSLSKKSTVVYWFATDYLDRWLLWKHVYKLYITGCDMMNPVYTLQLKTNKQKPTNIV